MYLFLFKIENVYVSHLTTHSGLLNVMCLTALSLILFIKEVSPTCGYDCAFRFPRLLFSWGSGYVRKYCIKKIMR